MRKLMLYTLALIGALVITAAMLPILAAIALAIFIT